MLDILFAINIGLSKVKVVRRKFSLTRKQATQYSYFLITFHLIKFRCSSLNYYFRIQNLEDERVKVSIPSPVFLGDSVIRSLMGNIQFVCFSKLLLQVLQGKQNNESLLHLRVS